MRSGKKNAASARTGRGDAGSAGPLPEMMGSANWCRMFFEQARDLILVLELPPDGLPVIRDANQEALRVFGYTLDELRGRPISFLEAEPSSDALVLERRRTIAKTGKLFFEVRHRCKDGSVFDAEALVTEMSFGGKRIAISIERDVTGRNRAEEELLLKNAILSAQQEVSLDGILVVDAAGRMISSNRRFAEMWGIPAEIMASGSDERALRFVMDKLVNPGEFIAKVKHLMKNIGETSRDEIVLKDGSTFDRYAAPLPGADGKPRGRVWYFRDITERKRVEERLTKLTDQVPGVVYQYRLYPDGRSCFPYASSGIKDIYEVTPEEVREDASIVFGRIHPDDLASTSAAIRDSARALKLFHWEFRVVLPRQGLRWRICRARPERLPDGGTLWYGIISDITERKNAEAERERLIKAIEQAQEIVLVTDPEGTIQYLNPAFEKVTGYGRSEAIGKTPRILKSGKQDAAFYAGLWTDISSGRAWEGRIVNKRKDGTLYTEEAAISPVRDSTGKIVNYVAVKRDITRQLQLEGQFLQAQKMEAVGVLAGGVAHDFNNILTAIKAYAEFIRKDLPPADPMRADAQEILDASDRAEGLTRQLLAFSRRQILAPRVVDLNKIVGDMTKMLGRLIGEDIRLTLKTAQAPCLARVDPGQIEQVVMNLAVNARDAMPKGGTITIETAIIPEAEEFFVAHRELPRGPLVRLTLRDTGCGMTEEVKGHVFEPFFTTKEPGKGTGLGLSTVFGIIKQSGGEVEVDSARDKGTTFTIYLPLAENAGQDKESGKNTGWAAKARGGETVLLVEDDPALRRLGERVLKAGGYAVLTAANGAEALAALERRGKPVDLLMTDVVMPGMSGRDLALEVVRRKMAGRTLYMSGYTDEAIVQHGVLEPGIAFIYKPFTVEALSVKLREVLDGPADKAKV